MTSTELAWAAGFFEGEAPPMTDTRTEAERLLYEQMPRFPWRRPVAVTTAGGRRYACRVCMGLPGKVRADEGITSWRTEAEVQQHITDNHPEIP